jgi:hypothetical protein
MGTLNNGPFGHLNGRVGNLVSYTLNGKNVTRIAGKTSKPPTVPKLAEYQRMRVTNNFLKPMLAYLNIGFAMEAEGTDSNAYNKALSYNKRYALQGDYPDISMDYSRAMVSKGPLPPAVSAKVTVNGNMLELIWQVPEGMEQRYLDNRAMIVIYFPHGTDETNTPEAVMELSGARRHECRDVIPLDGQQLGKPFEVYLAFIAADRFNVSDSVWADKYSPAI